MGGWGLGLEVVGYVDRGMLVGECVGESGRGCKRGAQCVFCGREGGREGWMEGLMK